MPSHLAPTIDMTTESTCVTDATQQVNVSAREPEAGPAAQTLRLVGLLDSPYVRRVAIALQFMQVPFVNLPLSVFRDYDQFAEINAVVKAPTLVCEDGCVLMDSSLVLQYAASRSQNSWWTPPPVRQDRAKTIRQEGLGLVTMDKAVQYVYETKLRPKESQYELWRSRVSIQLTEALTLLDDCLKHESWDFARQCPNIAQVTSAVAWKFCLELVPDLVESQAYPCLHRLSQEAEQLEEFRLAPHGEAPYPVT